MMKTFKKALIVCLILCVFLFLLASCDINEKNDTRVNEDTSTNSGLNYIDKPICVGLTEIYLTNADYGPKPYTAFRCAYQIENSVFDENEDISITLYFGADIEERNIEKEPLPNVKICIYNNVEKEETPITELSVNEIFVEKYDFDISHHYMFNKLMKIVVFHFNYSQELVLSNSLFTSNEGYLSFGISHTQETLYDYGYNYQFLHYKKENGKILLSIDDRFA